MALRSLSCCEMYLISKLFTKRQIKSISTVPNTIKSCKNKSISNRQKSTTPEMRTSILTAAGGSSAESPNITKLLEHNKKWVEKTRAADPNFFTELGKGQAPKYLYFGCSDSRVPANTILGLGPGEVFVHRNIGNLVPGNDLSALCVLEYAVTHLGVTDIMVTGHYKCGAIMASTMRQDLGTLENWLRSIRDVSRIYKEELSQIKDDNLRHEKLVEYNVIEQCLTLYKTGTVQRKRMESFEAFEKANGAILTDVMRKKAADAVYPRIHGLVFDPSEGLLKKLKVDFQGRIGSLESIYGLY